MPPAKTNDKSDNRGPSGNLRWYRQERPGNGKGRFHGRIVARNGYILFASQPIGYASKAGLLKAADATAKILGQKNWPKKLIEEIPEPVR